METIYCIANQKAMACYIGRTYQSVGERWEQHIWGAWKGKTESKLAEAIRHAPDDFEFLVLEQSTTASESVWMDQLKSEGWTLLNETGGNAKPPKRRNTDKERAWRDANAAANGAAIASEARAAGKPVQSFQEWFDEHWGDRPEPWERFAAAHPEYIATLRTGVVAFRASDGKSGGAMSPHHL